MGASCGIRPEADLQAACWHFGSRALAVTGCAVRAMVCNMPCDTSGHACDPWRAEVTNGMMYWSASQDALDAARAMLHGRPGQAFEELLPAGFRKHLRDNRDALAQTDPDQLPCHIWDLKDTAAYGGSGQGYLRCLLTRSHPWCHELQRSLLPAEALEAMGLPAFATSAARSPVKNPFLALVTSGGLTDRELRSLCGNGFHVPTVGVVLMWTLSLPVWKT